MISAGLGTCLGIGLGGRFCTGLGNRLGATVGSRLSLRLDTRFGSSLGVLIVTCCYIGLGSRLDAEFA